ncbi:MAG TPA: hypothetical protein PKD38_14870 [Nitrospira sp.]|nr:hypothetical protein [Nitrospira sp.]
MTPAWLSATAERTLSEDGRTFGHRDAELRALTESVIVVPLVETGILAVSGSDAAGFLHNLLTNDIAGLDELTVRRAGLCTPKGRLLADFLIWRACEAYMLQLPREILPAIQKKLSLYVLRAKVTIREVSGEMAVIGVAGVGAAGAVAALDSGLPSEGQQTRTPWGCIVAIAGGRYQVIVDAAAAKEIWGQLVAGGATPAGLDAWHLGGISAGDPQVVAATQDQFIPQMINYVQIGGLSFKKGCYPGQEIVARTQYLGKIKRHMYRATVAAADAAPGQPIYAPETGEQACGNVVCSAPSPTGTTELLAVIQTSCAEAGDLHLGNSDGPALVLGQLPYDVS